MSSARPATTTPSRASSGAASRSVRSVVSRRRDHASATGSSRRERRHRQRRRRRRGGDGDENSRRGAGNISGRTSRGLTKPYGAERPRRTPRRSRANVAVSTRRAAPYRSRVRRGARRRRARTPVRRRGGSPRPGAVPRRVPVGPEPREADHGDRRSESDTDPAEQRRDEEPSLQAGPASPASVTVRTTPVRYGTESAIETPTYEVRSRPFGGARGTVPGGARRRETGAQSRGDEAGKRNSASVHSQPTTESTTAGADAIVESEGKGRAILERISRPTNALWSSGRRPRHASTAPRGDRVARTTTV